jgi:hypothetical protein
MTASRASKLFAKERSLLVITMPTTPDQGALTGTALEEEAIQGVVGQKWAIRSLPQTAIGSGGTAEQRRYRQLFDDWTGSSDASKNVTVSWETLVERKKDEVSRLQLTPVFRIVC